MTFVDYLTQYNPIKDNQKDLSQILIYKHYITQQREIYKTLNMFKECGGLFVGLFWIPIKYENALFTAKNAMQNEKNLNPHIIQR